MTAAEHGLHTITNAYFPLSWRAGRKCEGAALAWTQPRRITNLPFQHPFGLPKTLTLSPAILGNFLLKRESHGAVAPHQQRSGRCLYAGDAAVLPASGSDTPLSRCWPASTT